jgi:hypothetical protein
MSDEKPWYESEFKVIIEDARTRHAAVITLMYSLDAQALALLRLYATVGIATGSGAVAGLIESTTAIPRPLAWSLLSITVVLTIGSVLCLLCLRSIRINLPGRDPDFWQWAINSDTTSSQVLLAYLENLKIKAADNLSSNFISSQALKWAKACCVVAPLVGVVVGLSMPH